MRRTDKLLEEIEKLLDKHVVIVEISKRTAFSYYNYRKVLVIVFKALKLPWEESDSRSLKVVPISAGVYQEYPIVLDRIIEEELSNKGYMVYVIDIF